MFKETEELNIVLEELESNKFIDIEAPLSSLSKFIKCFENSLEIDEDFLKEAAPTFLEMFSSPESILSSIVSNLEEQTLAIKNKNASVQEFNELLQLFVDVDAVETNKASELIVQSDILNSTDNMLESSCLVLQLDGLEGERLAKKIITIAPTLIEDSYKKYLSFLVSCKYLLAKSNKVPDGKLGVMLKQVDSLKTQYPSLIHTDISWLRNATAHRNWKYDVAVGSVIIWDDKTPVESLTPEELMIKIVGPFTVSSKVFFDASLYYQLTKIEQAFKRYS
ncbi:hypothetical protein Shal_4051 [Shewanella halifaxensis HAW-EB4]|uniref:Uncharacterized protein n=1 Tax=Shewanella halifaxensis (strain HAW-EB4) TaxID=458817 RepID=B0TKK5_SHEHH|nr:hypothetical protein [Shewanella halifaxensis]ABZ78591.1 hypothetical protein Shal_4051 [Shewanella halifaxensis HAW-EB4]